MDANHILAMMDHFTKFAWQYRPKTRLPSLPPKWFESTFAILMAVRRRYIQTRNCFKSEFFQQWCPWIGIKKLHTTLYHPQGNGASERSNCTLIKMLSSLAPAKKRKWIHYLAKVVCNIYKTTQYMFGIAHYRIRTHSDFLHLFVETTPIQQFNKLTCQGWNKESFTCQTLTFNLEEC